MYYGYVGGGIKTVLTDFRQVQELALKHPYSSYRKFWNEEKAWKWVQYKRELNATERIIRYGDVFKSHYVTLEYFVKEKDLYANIYTPRVGFLILQSDSENVHIENRTDVIKVRMSNMALGDSILGHLSAIYHLMQLIGDYIDVEIKVPDHSIFYAITAYSGNDRRVINLQNMLNNRMGSYALTIYDF